MRAGRSSGLLRAGGRNREREKPPGLAADGGGGGVLVTTPLLGFSCVVPIGPSPFLWEAPQEPGAGDRGCGFGPKLLSPQRICEESHSLPRGELPVLQDTQRLLELRRLSWGRASLMAASGPWSVVTSPELGSSTNSLIFIYVCIYFEGEERGRETQQTESEKERSRQETWRESQTDTGRRGRQETVRGGGGLGDSLSLDLPYFL